MFHLLLDVACVGRASFTQAVTPRVFPMTLESVSSLEVKYAESKPQLEALPQDEYCARIERVLEMHSQNLRDLFSSYMHKIEEKQNALWTGLQQQASRQSRKCAVEEQRLVHIEALLLQQSQNVHALTEEFKMMRWPKPCSQLAPSVANNGFFQSDNVNSRRNSQVYSQPQPSFDVQNWQAINQPYAPIDGQRNSKVPESSIPFRDTITLDLDGAFRYWMPDSAVLSPEKTEQEMSICADLEELLDADGMQDVHDSECAKTEDLQIGVDNVCTVMVKNIPCSCSKQDILDAIDSLGFADSYNFFHSPSRRGVDGNLGYAFVGFSDKDVTAAFANAITGYRFQLKGRNSTKSCLVVPARIQGLKSSLEHCSKSVNHRNSPTFSM